MKQNFKETIEIYENNSIKVFMAMDCCNLLTYILLVSKKIILGLIN